MTKSQYWQTIIDQWRKSGLAQKSFCAEHNIKLASLHYWLKKMRAEDRPESQSAAFIPVTVQPAVPPDPIEVKLGSLVVQCQASQLADVLSVFKQQGLIHATA